MLERMTGMAPQSVIDALAGAETHAQGTQRPLEMVVERPLGQLGEELDHMIPMSLLRGAAQLLDGLTGTVGQVHLKSDNR